MNNQNGSYSYTTLYTTSQYHSRTRPFFSSATSYALGGRGGPRAAPCAFGGRGNLNIKFLHILIYIFSCIDLYRNDLLLILSRMVSFYRAEAHPVAGFSAVKTARKASERVRSVRGEVRVENRPPPKSTKSGCKWCQCLQ